ncbi:DUF6308 family protein [Mycobacterium sp. 2YAF39]|uniref:DUF6308 family protein n=1 Tax=Mycobacterium sp. 2YAF39 TaxID=3233033 RepID=UPI003F9A95A7
MQAVAGTLSGTRVETSSAYQCQWHPYSSVGRAKFRYLALEPGIERTDARVITSTDAAQLMTGRSPPISAAETHAFIVGQPCDASFVHEFGLDLAAWFSDNADQVDRHLRRYFGGQGKDRFAGRWFDEFAAVGEPNRFVASDVLAVEALSVEVPPEAASILLITEADQFNSLLRQIPRDQDLWEVSRLTVMDGGPAADLHDLLRRKLPKVDWVTAGKLMAAKRPKLVPILDNKVKDFIRPPDGLFWVKLHDELSDASRRAAIIDACQSAPPHVSLLRRIDVALWMAATQGTRN